MKSIARSKIPAAAGPELGWHRGCRRRGAEVIQVAGVTAALAADGTLLAVMIALSWYGAVTLPPAARVPLHWGFGCGSYRSKRVGLIAWPAAGTVIYLLLGALGGPGWSHGNPGTWAPALFMIVVMGALAAFQAGALAAARRTVSGGPAGPDPR